MHEVLAFGPDTFTKVGCLFSKSFYIACISIPDANERAFNVLEQACVKKTQRNMPADTHVHEHTREHVCLSCHTGHNELQNYLTARGAVPIQYKLYHRATYVRVDVNDLFSN